ncbi:MAG TPA: glycosyltransferase family 2 protein [Chthoniobacterales bacterium]|jgi:glycosyltransferase involved in cell wall biosynthesis
MNEPPEFAIVIPCKNEAKNLAELVPEIVRTLPGENFEIVIVDDGSTDETAGVVRKLAGNHKNIRSVTNDRTLGKSAAIFAGVRSASAPIIVTIDGDGQNDPRHIGPLLGLMKAEGVGLGAGQRVAHAHSRIKRFSSRFANRVRDLVLKDNTRDSACGLKAFPRDLFLRLPFFNGMHRFLPALIMAEGYSVRHVDVTDRSRQHGKSKYGVVDRAISGGMNLMRVWWLVRRRRRP